MDEATASLDEGSDGLVQGALERSLAGVCTVLVVAHRLRTVIRCDRVLSLRAGAAVEFDAPAALLGLAAPREAGGGGAGLFAGLVADTGSEAEALRAEALEAELARGGRALGGHSSMP